MINQNMFCLKKKDVKMMKEYTTKDPLVIQRSYFGRLFAK